MRPEEVFTRVGKLPHLSLNQGCMFYDFIKANQLHKGLVLGFGNGVSTAYLAGAIQDIDSGTLTAIDLISARNYEPNIHWILESAGLSHFVQIHYEARSINWQLMKLLEANQYESYDFCYLNTAHSWYDTGLAFCVAERLLKPDGWVIFDNLHYTFRDSIHREKLWVKRMPEEEQLSPQVERVFELLVETNPHFGSFRRIGRFGFAQKRYPVWSREKRAQNDEDIVISRALERARVDPEYREELLQSPSEAMSDLTGFPCQQFNHLNFVDSDSFAPISSNISEPGKTIIYLERPSWENTLTESVLQKILED